MRSKVVGAAESNAIGGAQTDTVGGAITSVGGYYIRKSLVQNIWWFNNSHCWW